MSLTEPIIEDFTPTQKLKIGCIYISTNETNSITVSDGFVTFTHHCRYLGRSVLYNLCDEYDVDRRLAYASSSMVSLNHFWKDTYVETATNA